MASRSIAAGTSNMTLMAPSWFSFNRTADVRWSLNWASARQRVSVAGCKRTKSAAQLAAPSRWATERTASAGPDRRTLTCDHGPHLKPETRTSYDFSAPEAATSVRTRQPPYNRGLTAHLNRYRVGSTACTGLVEMLVSQTYRRVNTSKMNHADEFAELRAICHSYGRNSHHQNRENSVLRPELVPR